jgi:dTDP-4-amino-4,6-dideoxygalactose transaminase/glycosyltransferase involved in cell wall biosynthesis
MNLINRSNTLVVVPAYNEQDSIVRVLDEITSQGYSAIVVDDGSTDLTRQRAKAQGANVISLPVNAGVGAALKCGFKYAVENGYRSVIVCDADLQHNPSCFDQLVECAQSSRSDLVIGTRFNQGVSSFPISRFRLTGISIARKVLNSRINVEISDATSGFRFLTGDLLVDFSENFPSYYLGDTIESTVYAHQRGYKISETYTPMRKREMGASSVAWLHSVGYILKATYFIHILNNQRIKQSCMGLKPAGKDQMKSLAKVNFESRGEILEDSSIGHQPSTKQSTFVTKPYLPPLEEIIPMLEGIWDTRVLTNGGPLHERLETELCEHLGVGQISLFSNATIALVTAFKALEIKGEVITTPYSFVATTHSLMWNGIKPIFVDIDEESLNLDPYKIEEAITESTSAILAVHCYGKPCETQKIEEIAVRNNLKVIYDAAHAFGIQGSKGSILNEGDLSILSFHATKVFNTFEGGAIVCKDIQTKKRIDQLKNFGFVDEISVSEVGINGKMSELNSAVGIAQLRKMGSVIQKRRLVDSIYRENLAGIPGIKPLDFSNVENYNYSYFPILVQAEYPLFRDELYNLLKSQGIYTRRYFYPTIPEFSIYGIPSKEVEEFFPVAFDASRRILCLPIYPDLEVDLTKFISDVIKSPSSFQKS